MKRPRGVGILERLHEVKKPHQRVVFHSRVQRISIQTFENGGIRKAYKDSGNGWVLLRVLMPCSRAMRNG